MKRITTILTLLMFCMVVWAQEESPVIKVKLAETASGLPTAAGFGTFSGQTFTTTDVSGKAGVTVTASEGLTIGEQTVTSIAYGNCFKFVTAAAATDYTVTLSAPTGYYIKEYYMSCSANSKERVHTLTPENGDPVVVTSPPYQGDTPKDFKVTGLNAQTTSFTINTANAGNTLYVRKFTVTIAREGTEVVDVTYVVKEGNTTVFTSEPQLIAKGATITALPEEYQYTWFYDYAPVSETAEAGKTVQITATPKLFVPFTNFNDATWYYMTIRSNKYVSMGDNEPYELSTTNAETKAFKWAFSGNPYTGVKVYNKAAGSGKTLKKDSYPVMRDGEYSWTILPNNDGFVLQETWSYSNYVNDVNGKIGYWNNTAARTDDGSTFRLTEAPEGYIRALDEMENGKVYAIYNARGIWKFAENATSMSTEGVPSDLETLKSNPADAYQIGLVKQNDKFYIYNVAQGKYLAAGNKLYQSPLEAVTIVASTSSAAVGDYKWFFSFDSSHNINVSNGILIDNWTTHDQGNVNAIMVTDATYTVDDALAAFTDYTQCITDYCDYKGITTDFVNNIGQFGYPKAGTEATIAFTEIVDRHKSGTNTEEDFNTFMEKYNAILAGSNLTMPKAGQFLRIKSKHDTYLSGVESTEKAGRLSFTTETDASTIFYFDGNKLLTFGNGLYAKGRDVAAVGVAGLDYQFEASTVAVANYAIRFNPDGGTNRFLYAWGTDKNYADQNGADAAECAFTLEEVTELPVKMNVVGDKSYATFYSPVAISQVDGAKVYVVEQTKSNSVVIEEATTQAIPAGKGVMLVSDDKNTSATLTIGEAEDFETGLNGVTASEQITKDTDPYNSKLFLSKKDGKIGFYKIKTTDNVGVTGGFKAYLENVTVMSGAKDGFEIEFGGVTGIENMEHGTLNMENGAVYNLQGQRVGKAQKGVFIQNGRKVVVR